MLEIREIQEILGITTTICITITTTIAATMATNRRSSDRLAFRKSTRIRAIKCPNDTIGRVPHNFPRIHHDNTDHHRRSRLRRSSPHLGTTDSLCHLLLPLLLLAAIPSLRSRSCSIHSSIILPSHRHRAHLSSNSSRNRNNYRLRTCHSHLLNRSRSLSRHNINHLHLLSLRNRVCTNRFLSRFLSRNRRQTILNLRRSLSNR